jgi:hypothetical protein
MPRARRRRWWWAAVPLFLAAVAAGGWAARRPLGEAASWAAARAEGGTEAVAGWATRLRDIAATVPDAEIEERTNVGASRSVLVVLGSGPGDCAFALVAVSPEGFPTVTLLPATLLGVVPGYGEFTLAEALAFESPDLVALTVTNELGVRIDEVLPLAAGELAAALPATLTVDLPVPLFASTDGGLVQVLESGEQQLPGATIERLLVDAGAGDAFEWLQRQGAAWRGILAAIAADAEVADSLAASLPAGGAEAADVLLVVATADEVLLGAPPVESVTTINGDALALSPEAATEFVPARLGHLLLRAGERPRVEVLNGNGRIGATRVVAEALVRRGFRVVRTDNADRFDYATTLVIAQGEEAQAAAQEVAGIVGAPVVYLEEAAPSLVVEVSIIVGLDIPAGEA